MLHVHTPVKKRRILVVDDDPDILDALELILLDAGYEVKSSLHGKTVKNIRFESNYPDLLLLDVSLSGMDGRELCRMLKSSDTTKKLPVVMISANLNAQKEVLFAGADAFISKPFEVDYLLSVVSKLIN